MSHKMLALGFVLAAPLAVAGQEKKPEAPAGAVSFDRQVRPILQAHCYGCHQPAKAKGKYVMTSHDRLLSGGESGDKAIVPGAPDKSHLLAMIAPDADGKAEMPKGGEPLAAAEIELIKKWIAEGAADDTPENVRTRYDTEHPPVYLRPPVITSMDFSPDGQWLAIAGFHEVLLMKGDGSELAARLVGLSERVQSVRFSPDGARLAVAAGRPSRGGEIQIWEVEKRKLELAVPVGYDTLYGVSWSPDGARLAFGAADHTVRAIDAKSGAIVVTNSAHTDWVQDTVWSEKGTHVVAVDRDGTAKLVEAETQRFVDNVTSITPGALKGGIAAVARHPTRDEIVIGGADGQPKVYRIFRLLPRKIGDDHNLIRKLPPMNGRIWSVAVSRDGKRIAAGSGLDGRGEVALYSYEFDTALPEAVKTAAGKDVYIVGPETAKLMEEFTNKDVKRLWSVPVEKGIVYAVAFRPDGAALAVAGADGVVRILATENGSILKEFSPAPVEAAAARAEAAPQPPPVPPSYGIQPEAWDPSAGSIASLQILPEAIALSGPFDTAQLVVLAALDNGATIDVTRMVETKIAPEVARILPGARLMPAADGRGELTCSVAGQSVKIPVTVGGLAEEPKIDFIRDVNPVLSRVGCTAGTCHGAQKGRNGFKLSLRGYDAVSDIRALTDDLASRRVNVASPDDSLMLLKPSTGVPHEGGHHFKPSDPYYRILRAWIAQGAKLDLSTPRVASIEIFPKNPVTEKIGSRQQVRVVATYADGRTRDVTHEAIIDSGNTEVATAARGGLMTAVRRGEAPILARFEGAYAATTLTVMGERKGFAWNEPPAYNPIDTHAAAKWRRMKIRPSEVCTDAEFIRRVTLDLTGLPPTADEVRAFLSDRTDYRARRAALVERLIGSDAFVEHWTNKWADLLQVNGKFLGAEGAAAFRGWIRERVAKNMPYDQFVREIVAADGSTKQNPAAAYYKILREPGALVENTTHLFLATRFNCTKCHDHPFERWTQDQYYETSAFFARVDLKDDPASGGKTIGGTDVEGAKPLFEIVSEKAEGEVTHLRTGVVAAPKFPFESAYEAPPNATRRQTLAAWITSPKNPYFARSFVNRLWGYLFGVGIIDPIDDIRAGNPPSNPELLQYLTDEFIGSKFDVRHVIRLITTSRTYQLSVQTNEWNKDDRVNFSHALARRLPAEALFDSVHAALGSIPKIPGVQPGMRAAQLADAQIDLPGGFLGTFGRPARESACECERTSELRLGAVMSLITGATLSEAIADPANVIPKLVQEIPDDDRLVDELFLRILNRPARPSEIEAFRQTVQGVPDGHTQLQAALQKRQTEWDALLPKLQKEREEAMAQAKADLEAYEAQIAPRVKEAEEKRAQAIAKAEAELKEAEDGIPAKITDYEKKANLASDWTVLLPVKLQATNKAVLTVQPDFSVMASGKAGQGDYVVTAHTDLKAIRAVRLECIADPKLPSKGPGRAGDGNFVVSQFTLTAAPKAEPEKAAPVALQNARSDFHQLNFDVKKAIDGSPEQGKGWAVSPSTGVTHWATFELKEPVGHDGGTILTFTISQIFGSDLMLGRFRLSITTAAGVELSQSDELRVLLATPQAQRTKEQKEALLAYFKSVDLTLGRRRTKLAEVQKPIPPDPGVIQRKQTLEYVSRPLSDPILNQLKVDLDQSGKQAAAARLTAAQDLAWALINSPAFLFNH